MKITVYGRVQLKLPVIYCRKKISAGDIILLWSDCCVILS